jgi:2-dehydro-3-deoxygluconokinase
LEASELRALGAIGEGLVELTVGPGRREVAMGFGGDAANVAVMAARLGAPVRLAGRAGADAMGDRLVGFWREQGIDVSGIRRDAAAPTGVYANEPGPEGHRFVYWRSGSAGSRLEPGDLADAFFEGLGVLVVTGVTLAVSETSARAATAAAERAREAGATIAFVLNHRPALDPDIAELERFARASDVVIASSEDMRAAFGGTDRELGAEEVVLTDGERPAQLLVAGRCVSQPVPDIAVQNAAGAGDALAGAYLTARLRDLPPATALAWGVAAAALSVQRDGCAASYPTAAETLDMVAHLPRAEHAGAHA